MFLKFAMKLIIIFASVLFEVVNFLFFAHNDVKKMFSMCDVVTERFLQISSPARR